MYYCYILYSPSLDQTYTGYTTNLDKRMNCHKLFPTRTTKRATDYILVWYAAFKNKQLAKSFERYLKSHSGRSFARERLLGALVETWQTKFALRLHNDLSNLADHVTLSLISKNFPRRHSLHVCI